MTSYASPAADEALPVHIDTVSGHQRFAAFPAERLLPEAIRILRYELDLPAYDRRREAVRRLRAWLQLPPTAANRLAVAFDEAAKSLDPVEREELRQTEQEAVMDGLSYAEFRRLADIVPSLRDWRTRIEALEMTQSNRPGCLATALALLEATVQGHATSV